MSELTDKIPPNTKKKRGFTRNKLGTVGVTILLLAIGLSSYRGQQAYDKANGSIQEIRHLGGHDRERIREIKQLGEENRKLIVEIKASRRNSILTACNEENAQHTTTRNGLKILIGQGSQTTNVKMTYAQRKQQQHFFNVFVAAIKPKYDCNARLKEFLQP